MGFDLAIFELISGLTGRFFILDTVGIISAKYLPFLLVGLFIIYAFSYEGWKKRLFTFIFAALGLIISNGFFVKIIKYLYEKPRPFETLDIEPLVSSSGFAFPSGHASFFFTLAFILFLFNKKWGTWFIVLASLNSIARIFVGIHWPVDIIGGVAVATLSFGVVYILLQSSFDKIINKQLK